MIRISEGKTRVPTNSKDRQVFLVGLSAILVMVMAFVVIIDLGIKASILEESMRLREVIANGRGKEESTSNGAGNHTSRSPILLGEYATRMETGDVPEVVGRKNRPPRKTNPESEAPGGTGEVPEIDQ